MGVFPEDFEIPVKKLIRLWVADGFLEPSEPKSLEELAEECLEDLVQRNLVLVADKRSNGGIRSCKIHDVLRDLSITKGREERFLRHFNYMDRDNTLLKLFETQCRVSFHYIDSDFLKTKTSNSALHTLLYFDFETTELTRFASQFTSLRVLDELLVDSKIFPNEIFELVNLRYLAFTYKKSDKCMISPSISKLQNLQTLIINGGGFISDYMCQVILPMEIWKMPRLRHLILMRNTFLSFPYDSGLGGTYSALEDLQTLSNVMNFKFTKETVEGFPNLKKLRLQYRGFKHKHWANFGLGNLVYLQELEELNFQFHLGIEIADYSNPFQTNIAFPRKLRKLTLTESWIPWEKMWMVGSLPNLEVLKLMANSFVGEEWETTEGEFLVLKHLEMESIRLREWRVERDHFPCLERLIIRWCFVLKVPSCVGDIPTLETLTMQGCNVKAEDSVRLIEAEQRSLGNDVLKVHISFPS